MLALCLMLLHTYYAKNYAGIIDSGLAIAIAIAMYIRSYIHAWALRSGMYHEIIMHSYVHSKK